jgi:ubiquinone/menaquinone biosynthesis C-methylase UbiE
MTLFSKEKGYAFEKPLKVDHLQNKINQALKIISSTGQKKLDNILVAGCGKGDEAYQFFKLTTANIFGVDLNVSPVYKTDSNREFCLTMESIDKLAFPNDKFDLIYCYHVLEHVKEPEKVLLELKRVLSKNGILFIGFPNRKRILPGYFSSHSKITLVEIIKFNYYDYKMRLVGRFKNEFGAHAGFTEKEFFDLTEPIFSSITSVRKVWIENNYPKFTFILNFLEKIRLADYFYPSNYFIIKK